MSDIGFSGDSRACKCPGQCRRRAAYGLDFCQPYIQCRNMELEYIRLLYQLHGCLRETFLREWFENKIADFHSRRSYDFYYFWLDVVPKVVKVVCISVYWFVLVCLVGVIVYCSVRVRSQADRVATIETNRQPMLRQALYTDYGEARLKQMYLEAGEDMVQYSGCDPSDESCNMDDKELKSFEARTGLSDEQYYALESLGFNNNWPNRTQAPDAPAK